MSKVTTNVTLVAVNNVSEEDKEQLLAENPDCDTFEEVARSMEADVRAIVRHKLFGDADELPILDVNIEVE